ncbi:MAG: hypothetical protein QXI38_00190, partial [Conexivisphaerales archaeon]
MSTEFSPQLRQVFDDIKSMKVRGAGRIARAAVAALKNEVFYVNDDDSSKFFERIQKAGEYLKSSRPTAVSLPNGVNTVVKSAQKGLLIK